jgi:hypothetical protein
MRLPNPPKKKQLIERLRHAGLSPNCAGFIATALLDDVGETSPTMPSVWWDLHPYFDAIDSIEVVMHLLFLGIVQSTCCKDIIYKFLTGRKQWSCFVSRTNVVLNPRVHLLSLSWIRAPHSIAESGTFGGWVSKNYSAFARMYKFVAALTEKLRLTDIPYQDPVQPISTCNLSQLKEWLLHRKMKVVKRTGQTQANTADYLHTIQSTGWQQPGDHPVIGLSSTTDMPMDVLEDVVVSCHSLVCRIMSLTHLPTERGGEV